MTGNQIAALLAEYLLERRRGNHGLSRELYVVKTLVTTELVRRIAEQFGVRTLGDLQVGFKYIGGVMDQEGTGNFVFGCEESHGYLVGSYVRDKDAAVAAMLLARTGRPGQGVETDAARKTRCALLAIRLPCRGAGLGDDARLGGDGANQIADGPLPLAAAGQRGGLQGDAGCAIIWA